MMVGDGRSTPPPAGGIPLEILQRFDDALAAVKSEDASALSILLKSSVGPTLLVLKHVSTKSLLHFAIETGNTVMIGKLLDVGADPFVQDKWGKTALHYAASLDVTAALAVVCEVPGRAYRSRIGELRRIKDFEGLIALHYAARGATDLALSSLLRNIPDVDDDALAQVCIEDTVGSTALHHAAEEGNNAGVRLLIKSGAKIDHTNHLGNTALHRACRKGNEATARLLIQLGSDATVKNDANKTALDLARKANHAHVVTFLQTTV
eukprot:m.90754 g.90754  ORF g.90754 m.90754 type:complete len:265 (+) comp26427_c0_seq4:223-1017(+)